VGYLAFAIAAAVAVGAAVAFLAVRRRRGGSAPPTVP
jgi:hypothetical protein